MKQFTHRARSPPWRPRPHAQRAPGSRAGTLVVGPPPGPQSAPKRHRLRLRQQQVLPSWPEWPREPSDARHELWGSGRAYESTISTTRETTSMMPTVQAMTEKR